MADLRTAEQCYRTAARLLATADGTLQDRLLAAYLFQGVRAYPPDTSGPEIVDGMLAERMRELHYALTVEDGDRYRCSIEVTVGAMDETDAEALAHELVEIAAALAYLVGRLDQAHHEHRGDDAADPAGGAASTGGSVAAFSLSKGLGGSPFARYPHAV